MYDYVPLGIFIDLLASHMYQTALQTPHVIAMEEERKGYTIVMWEHALEERKSQKLDCRADHE